MSENRDLESLMELLGDGYARAILAATSREPMSAKALSEEIGASKATVYRRVDTLLEHDLLVERTRSRADGSRFTIYEANLTHFHVDLADGRFEVAVQTRGDVPERVTGQIAYRLAQVGECLRRITGKKIA